jgi:hypothetical protein
MSDHLSSVFISTLVLCGVLTLWTISRVYDVYKSKRAMKTYAKHMEWVHRKWGFQMPFTYPKTGPDPRGPVRRLAALSVSI